MQPLHVERLVVGLLFALTAGSLEARERSVSDAFAPGAETVWRVEVNGEEIGHNWSRYEGEVDLAGLRAHHFLERVLLDTAVPGGRLVQRYDCELWADGRGRPLRLELRAVVSDMRSAVDATFAGGKVSARIRQGPTDQTRELDVAADAFVLANNFVSQLELALAIAAPPEGQAASLPFFSVNALRGFPLALEPVNEEPESPGKVFRDSLGEVLHLDAQGRLERVEVPAQSLVFRRVTGEDATVEAFAVEPPAAAAQADDLDREDVRIEYQSAEGPVSIAGTITRPRTRPPGQQGPWPAVFFVSGSGGQDREGTSGGIDIGTHEILDRLTREGFLVLRVDDRGVGESTGPGGDLSFDDLVDDARHAVRFLQSRDDVDDSRIAVIGHSEGGQTAPILAAEMELAAVVLMAGPGRSIDQLLREQLVYGRRLAGGTEKELAELDRAVAAFLGKVGRGEPVSAGDLPPELAAFAGAQAWLKSHMAQDPIANLKRVRAPVLVLQGARDIQVSAERDTKPLEAALRESGHADFEVVVFPELDHLFKKTIGEESSGLDYLRDRPVDAEFLDTLVEWLKKRLL